jgi:hypothetical protein
MEKAYKKQWNNSKVRWIKKVKVGAKVGCKKKSGKRKDQVKEKIR